MSGRTTDPGHNVVTRFCLTHSGRRVEAAGGTGAPSVHDMAVQCGRTPRFAGATRGWWSVLHHLLVCHRIAESLAAASVRDEWTVRLAVLTHDGHEGPTGDTPSPYKPAEMSAFQAELDRRIYAELLGDSDPFPDHVHRIVKEVDRRALYAEGLAVGPPGEAWVPEWDTMDEDVDVVLAVRDAYPQYHDTLSPDGRAVIDWCRMVETYVRLITEDDE